MVISKIWTKSNFIQWHSIAYCSTKITLAETRYKTHNLELIAIIEAFKIWHHYLKDYKHKLLVLIIHNCNNLVMKPNLMMEKKRDLLSKIIYVSILTPISLAPTMIVSHFYYPCINLDITSYMSIPALSRAKLLHIIY